MNAGEAIRWQCR